MEFLKVSSKSSPASVAGAIAGMVKDGVPVNMQCVGAGAVNHAVFLFRLDLTSRVRLFFPTYSSMVNRVQRFVFLFMFIMSLCTRPIWMVMSMTCNE